MSANLNVLGKAGHVHDCSAESKSIAVAIRNMTVKIVNHMFENRTQPKAVL